ncbi:MAG: hypothetical protein GWP63_21385 [Haliea sp.]|nr:hypothetical protein [Haliea sp.]
MLTRRRVSTSGSNPKCSASRVTLSGMATFAMAMAVSACILLPSKVIHFSGTTSTTTRRSESSSEIKACCTGAIGGITRLASAG